MGIPDFKKYHGLGNDYVVIDPSIVPFEPTPERVRAVCDRNYGIGADAVLVGPLRDASGLDMRIFNPDGSEAEKSGNGLRVFVWYLHERGLVGAGGIGLATKGGSIRAFVDAAEDRVVRVDMGPPSFDPAAIGLRPGTPELVGQDMRIAGRLLNVTAVSMGNPHCVILLPGASALDAKTLGPLIELGGLFTNRANVDFMEVEDRSSIRVETWERGAGYTLGSGSSACAAAAAARRLGLVGGDVTVRLAGGALRVRFDEEHAFLSGPVEPVFEGTFSREFRARLGR